jgi:DNA mismatch repair protein MutL
MSADEFQNKFGRPGKTRDKERWTGSKEKGFTASRSFDTASNDSQFSYSQLSIPDSQLSDSGAILPYRSLSDRPLEEINDTAEAKSFRVIGEVLKTYIVVEFRDGVWLIDKHAAHERIHFDALKLAETEPMAQTLISPVVCRHGQVDISIILENTDLLDRLGFSIESFGEDAVVVRRIPAEIELSDVEPVISEICAQLKHGGIPAAARRDNIYRVIACKAAIKAGKMSGLRELEALSARVLSGEVAQCPHGRPVAFEISKNILDRGFKRI